MRIAIKTVGVVAAVAVTLLVSWYVMVGPERAHGAAAKVRDLLSEPTAAVPVPVATFTEGGAPGAADSGSQTATPATEQPEELEPSSQPAAPVRSTTTQSAQPAQRAAGSLAFGLATPNAPTGRAEIAAAAAAAGARVDIVQYFADAQHPLNVKLLNAAAADGATPMLSLETPTWSTADIAAGRYDQNIKNLAHKLAQFNNEAGGTVLLRLNHEMNGHWYPWAEGTRGNPPGAYAAAWRRFVDTVRQTGTGRTTVLWIWSPNILRGAQEDAISQAYPGDQYVDYLGLTGYGDATYERTPADTFDKTLHVLRSRVSASKPIMITESGAGPGKYKVAWTRALGPWLRSHPDIRAFVWFDKDTSSGANDDWRFTPYHDVADALRLSLAEAGATTKP